MPTLGVPMSTMATTSGFNTFSVAIRTPTSNTPSTLCVRLGRGTNSSKALPS